MSNPVLSVSNLRVEFRQSRGLLRRSLALPAVRDVSFLLSAGETLAIVGESGSGKSTIARSVMRLIESCSGTIKLHGEDITRMESAELRTIRRRIQMVFQDPYASLDPTMTIAELVAEPLMVHERKGLKYVLPRARKLVEQVGLSNRDLTRYPNEFSGGQRQRIAIARAIALEPSVLILDEAVSALDVSTRNQVLQLLKDLQAETDMAYLFISHDLGVVRQMADRIAVAYLGRIVETGSADDVLERSMHPYTRTLVKSVLVADPTVRLLDNVVRSDEEVPNPLYSPPGCAFHPRCTFALADCRREVPPLKEHEPGHRSACLLASDLPKWVGSSDLSR